jgi:nucleoside-diphosphate-sugar epimerase
MVHGDLCNIADVGEAVKGVDAVIHLGALIPPAADRHPGYARYVNLGGTLNIIRAMKESAPDALLVYTSSVAVYGDRLASPNIKVNDEPHPNSDDYYAHQKLAAEKHVRESGLRQVVFRLTAIMSSEKLKLDPLMYRMPLATSLEICSPCDTARALCASIETTGVEGKLFHLAGGEKCRTSFGDYLHTVFEIMGLGRDLLPDAAFSTDGYHCGYMETSEPESLLSFQHDTLDDHYAEVRAAVRGKRFLLRILRPLIRSYLLRRSSYWMATRRKHRERFGSSVARRRAHLPV